MARLVQKCESGVYTLIVPEDTTLSDLELNFAVYDKLGALEELEDNGLLYRKVFYITDQCTKPSSCLGQRASCDRCPINHLVVRSNIIPFSEFNPKIHFNTEEEAKSAIDAIEYEDIMNAQEPTEFHSKAYSIAIKYNVGQLVAECYLCNHGNSYPCTRCNNQATCMVMRNSDAANKGE